MLTMLFVKNLNAMSLFFDGLDPRSVVTTFRDNNSY